MHVSTDGSSSEGPYEGMTDDDADPHPLATPSESYLWGLLKGKGYSRSNVIVRTIDNHQKGAYATKDFHAGQFVCEYGSSVAMVEETDEKRKYCLFATYQGQQYVFDATSRVNDPGRYIQNAIRNANVKQMPPVLIGDHHHQRLRIGFVASRDIKAGEQLMFDYRCKKTTKQQYERPRQECTVEGCYSLVKKLADHYRVTHKMAKEERDKHLAMAKKVGVLCI